MNPQTEIRKKDIINSVALVGFCLVFSVVLYFIWVRTVNDNLEKISRKAKTVQAELTRSMEATKKAERLSHNIKIRQAEVEENESGFPRRKDIIALHKEIYDIASTYQVKVSEVEGKAPVFSEAGFLEARYTIDLTGTYQDLLKFVAHFEGKELPIYFSRLRIEALSADTARMKLRMAAYAREEEVR